MRDIRWGIISTGNIASQMADAVNRTQGATLLAVGSRSMESADKFADRFNIPRRYDSYEKLVEDADVDVVYVGTPHPFHHDNTILALEHRKAVLCEKPLAMTSEEAAKMIDVAREKKVFLMEAMWTRFLPSVIKARELIDAGTIGTPMQVQADFGFRAEFNAEGRLFNPELGGGALLDAGVYPVSFASMLFGRPNSIRALGRFGETGVDEECVMVASYEDGKTALLSAATRLETPNEAIINGTEGRIILHKSFLMGGPVTLIKYGSNETIRFDIPKHDNGYIYEVEHVNQCLHKGLTESPIMPLQETLHISETMDAVFAQWT